MYSKFEYTGKFLFMGKRTETNQTDCDADFLFDQTHLDAGCLLSSEDATESSGTASEVLIEINNSSAPIGSLLFLLGSALLIIPRGLDRGQSESRGRYTNCGLASP